MTASITAALADADGWDGHMGWGGGWVMLIWGTLVVAGLVVSVVWLARTTDRGGNGSGRGDDSLASARRILAERYAGGEISTDDYRERLDQLE